MKRALTTRRGILAAGNFIIDRVSTIDHYPAQDGIAAITKLELANGGAPFNALCDWARLGVGFPLAAAARVGRDAEGDWVLAELHRLGVDGRHVRRDPSARTSWSEILTEAGSGRRTIFHHVGASAGFGPADVPIATTRARILFLGFLGLLPALDARDPRHGTGAARLLAAARARGLVTAADVVTDRGGRLPRLVRPALRHLDYFFCNELEAELLTGVRCRPRAGALSRAALERAARRLARWGAGTTVVIHAREGALALPPGAGPVWQGSVRVPDGRIAGTNGAGDAFLAGYLAAIHDGSPPSEALRLAVCVAAASLLHSTPSGGVRSRAACLALGRRWGFRD